MASEGPILIVEDHLDSRIAMAEFLRQSGLTVVAAADGQEAFNLLLDGLTPCVMLIDLKLPQVSGLDLLTFIYDDPELRQTPVFVLTGLPPGTFRVVADRVFSKPVDLDAIVHAIRELVAAGKTECIESVT